MTEAFGLKEPDGTINVDYIRSDETKLKKMSVNRHFGYSKPWGQLWQSMKREGYTVVPVTIAEGS